MAAPGIRRVGVVGLGAMGAGIAQLAIEAGYETIGREVTEELGTKARDRIAHFLQRKVDKEQITAEVRESALSSLTLTTDLGDFADCDLIVEAIVEDLGPKLELFAELERIVRADTILATNTSALSVTEIAAATSTPERVVGMHFFNPAPLMPLVEVVRAPETDADSVTRATALMERWGKTPVVVADAPGFIVNRVNRPFTIEALRILEAGEAGISDIDAAIRAAGYPMGPFELMDLIGIDVNLAVATAIYEGLGSPDRLRPSPIQERLVEEGRLGRKTGAGFYAYHDGQRGDAAADLAVAGGERSTELVARIESAIAIEAELALGDEIATADSIDLALRLGAGHPSGPFESGRAHG